MKHWTIYGLGAFGDRLVGFLMLPIYTRYLTPLDYGVLELLVMMIGIVELFTGLGMRSAVVRFYHAYEGEDARREVISTAVTFTAVLTCAVAVFPLLQAERVSGWLFQTEQYAPLVRLALVGFVFNSMLHIPMAHLQARERPVWYAVASLVRLVVALTLNVLFVVHFELGIQGILLSSVITGASLSVVLVTMTVCQVGISLSFRKSVEMVRFGAPTGVTGLGWQAMHSVERILIYRVLSSTELGLYSLGVKFASAVAVFFSEPFRLAWAPLLYVVSKRDDADSILRRVFHYWFLAVSVLSLAVAMWTEDVLHVIAAPAFWPAHRFVPVLAVASLIFSTFPVLGSRIYVSKRTELFSASVIVSAGASVALYYWLIPLFFVWGAAASRVMGFLLVAVLLYGISQRLHRMDYGLAQIFKVFGTATLAFLLSRLIPAAPLVVSMGLKVVLLAAVPVLLVPLGFYQHGELGRLRSMAQRLLGAQWGAGVSQREPEAPTTEVAAPRATDGGSGLP